MSEATSPTPRRALVLSGGGARGAYEAGVLRYLLDELPRRLGHPPRIDFVTGTSVGAIHACFVAATAHLEEGRGARIARVWDELRADALFGSGALEVLRLPRRMLEMVRLPSFLRGDAPPPDRLPALLDTRALESLVVRSVPWRDLRRNLRAGRLAALCVAATEIATGRVVVFADGPEQADLQWSDPGMVGRLARIGPAHALASAAIPMLFPAVRLGGTYYADGGLRMNTPLAPAVRLGADRVMVIALRRGAATGAPADLEAHCVEHYGNPLYLFGKVLNALLLDHVETDLALLHLINDVLRQVEEAGGRALLERLRHRAAGSDRPGPSFRIVDDLVIHPSADLGVLAGETAQQDRAAGRASAALRLMLGGLGIGEEPLEADLLSYLYFDASYTHRLLELGFEDARSQEEELLRFFGP